MSELISRKLILSHINAGDMYPAKMKNRDTGIVAYRLSKSGNTKKDSIEVADESEMIRKVVEEGYMVRAQTLKSASQGGRTGLYRIGQRSITSYKIIS